MTDLINSVQEAAHTVAHAFDGHPTAPPPMPVAPSPVEPPELPPMYPPYPPLIVCPPAMPPPLSPPGFQVWAAQVPSWFWWMFVLMGLIACCGTVAIVYILRELRAQRKGLRLPKEETAKALAGLEARMGRRGL